MMKSINEVQLREVAGGYDLDVDVYVPGAPPVVPAPNPHIDIDL